MRLLFQCWCWSNRDLLCAEYSPGEGEGRGHPGCIPDSQESQAAAATHGADTGEGARDVVSTCPQQQRGSPVPHRRGLAFYCQRTRESTLSYSISMSVLSPPFLNICLHNTCFPCSFLLRRSSTSSATKWSKSISMPFLTTPTLNRDPPNQWMSSPAPDKPNAPSRTRITVQRDAFFYFVLFFWRFSFEQRLIAT